MTRRALLIGSETYGLSGCDADVALMGEVLAGRGFDAIDVRTGSDASRAGIIDGLEALIAGIQAGDAVVVYYSGHGGRVARPDFGARKAAGLSVYFQFIVPHDMSDSVSDDFRGILSEELTQYQRRMTDAFRHLGEAPNVTTVLDCCHSGYMARDAEARQKSVDFEPKMFRIGGIRQHAQQLGAQAEIGALATDPDAVRIVACQPEQSAFEFASRRGGCHGALTDALASVLEDIGPAPVSWAMVGDLVRRRVRALVPEQRPEVEGPTERLLFSPDSLPDRTALPVTVIEGVVTIEAAQLLGISVGDEFQLVVAGDDEPIGTAVVGGLDGGDAVLTISPDAARVALDGSAVVVPTRISVPKVLVHLDCTGGGVAALRDLLEASQRVGISSGKAGACATIVRVEGGGLAVLDQLGAPWRTAEYPDDGHGHQQLVQVLDAIAVGHRLLDLPSGDGPNALVAAVTIGFGVVDAGVQRPQPRHGARLTAGAPVFLTLRNTSEETLFVWVFDVGVSGRSSLLTNAAPSGTMLGPAGAQDDTLHVWGPLGETLFWPDDVPTEPASDGVDSARPETFVILIADRRSDLSSLASHSGAERGVARSTLDAIIDEARTGVREVTVAEADESPLRYRLEPVEFLLASR